MKRRLVIIAIFLLTGAVVNVAVAWGCCMYGQPGFSTNQRVSRSDREWLSAQFPSMELGRALTAAVHWGFGDEYYHVGLMVGDGRSSESVMGTRARAGWPCFAMTYSHFMFMRMQPDLPRQGEPLKIQTDEKFVGVIKLRGWLSTHAGITALPAHVLWPGFLLNTMLYGAVMYLPFALFTVRRWNRVRRGLCPKCAYPRGESDVCSECGKALPSPKVTTT